ncbi:esterase [Paucibacter sp. R3-3]|uniref:Esterase n=1 Tax=Roseateles agri TaxID=3098619 RepID=A0ABU5DE18_9BURK|nr:esterase [Paucibacter sp. R3-3]MDY0744531.1 esterase [Paucibacter sp. R3-3]
MSTSDPRAIVSLPAQGQKPQLLFVLLHGVGMEAAQMAPLDAALRAQYPQAAIVSLNAPHEFDRGEGRGFQWFSSTDIDDGNRAARVAAALPALVTRVRAWAAHFELDWPLVALAGFSQGGIVALEAVQAEPQLAGRVIAIGSRYATLPEAAPDQVSVHLLHGTKDEVLPYRLVVDAAKQLMALGADVTADVLPGIGHELHPKLVDKAMEQLRTFVPARLWREAMKAAQEQGLAPEQ